MILLVGLIGICGVYCVIASGSMPEIMPLIVMPVITFLAYIVEKQLKHDFNHIEYIPIFYLVVFLTFLGLIEVLRLQPKLFIYQAGWAVIGLILFYLIVKFLSSGAEQIMLYTYTFGAIAIVLLLSTLLFGSDIGGNKNWIIIGPIRFQPSEFAKIFMVLFFAGYLTEKRELLLHRLHIRFIAPLLTMWGITMLMLVGQRDLGAALLFYLTALIMIYMATNRKDILLAGISLFILGAVVCYFVFEHVRVRIDIWLNPWLDPAGKSYQIIQSLFAIGSGGILGSGLGYGYPTMVPAVYTDFTFAAISEELGFTGAFLVLVSYLLIVYKLFMLSLQTKKSYMILASAGLATFFALQVFLIVGGVTKFVPLTGVTLPFISYGGSSLVSNYIMFGLIFVLTAGMRRNYE